MPSKKFKCNSCFETKKKHLSGCKLTQKSRVLFHQGVDFGMPANWMSYHGHIWSDMKSHNCADRWTKLLWSLLLPRLKKELLIACCSFCSYPLTLCDNLVLMACTPVCMSKMRVATSNMGETCLLNHPHCTATRELSPRNVWVLLHSKHIWLQHKYQFVSRACKEFTDIYPTKHSHSTMTWKMAALWMHLMLTKYPHQCETEDRPMVAESCILQVGLTEQKPTYKRWSVIGR